MLGRRRDPFNQNFRKFQSKTEWIGSDQPVKLEKISPPFAVEPVRSKWTVPTHSQSQDLAIRYYFIIPRTKWRKIPITALLWIVNSRSVAVTRTSMYSYGRSVAVSQAKCMFWLLTALKNDLFPERIWNVFFFVI